jgi:hypothetical protein
MATSATDYGIFRPLSDSGEKPATQLRDAFLVGNFVQTLPTGSSRYVTQMYEQAKEIEEAYASYRNALKIGDRDRAAEIRAEDGDKIRQYKRSNAIKKQMSNINQKVKAITADRNMSSADKRAAIDRLNDRKNRIAKRYSDMIS